MAKRQVVLTATVGMLALFTGGCSYFTFLPWVDDPDDTDIVVTPSPTPQETPTEEFPNPLEPGQQQQPQVGGLVQPTNPEERIPQIQQGREDPFALIPVEPLITVLPTEEEEVEAEPTAPGEGTPPGQQQVAQVPQIPPPGQQPGRTAPGNGTAQQPGRTAPGNGTAQQPGRTAPGNGTAQQPGRTAPGNGTAQQPGRTAPGQQPGELPEGIREIPGELPPVPQADLADSIAVSGVIQVGNLPQAIIQAPNEPYSRYVKAGQYVANGAVLVKRIEVYDGPVPVVVFEQNGIEIAREVGAGVETDVEEEGTPTAMLRTTGRRRL